MAAASGITPTQDTLNLVEELRKNNSKLCFALFKVEGTTIVPEYQFPDHSAEGQTAADLKTKGDAALAAGFKDHIWPAFVKKLANAPGPRFAVIDFARATADGRIAKTLVSVSWCSDRASSAREKMTFASTKTAFEVKINVGKKHQANDESDLEYDAVHEVVSK